MIAISSAVNSIMYDYKISQKDSRSLAKEWIEKKLPDGSEIVLESYSPPLEEYVDKQRIEAKLREWLDNNPRRGNRLKWQLSHKPEHAYHITEIPFWDKMPQRIFKRSDIDYIILSSYSYDRWFTDTALKNHSDDTQNRRQFYRTIRDNFKLIKKFNPDKGMPGPTIEIYKVNEESSNSNLDYEE